jgi:Ca-activated chloride channel homolog
MNARTKIWIGSISLVVLLSGALVLVAEQTPVPPQAPAQPAAQAPPQPPADADDPKYKLAVDVELVNIVATVLDENQKYMENLKKEDFTVLEDGQEQPVSFFSHDLRVPISVGVLVDTSGSMKRKLQQALQTVREVALSLSPQDEIFLITFNSDVEVRQTFTSNIQDFQKSLKDIRAGGETAAYDAISTGLQEMKHAKNTKKTLIFVTDGFDTKSKIRVPEVTDLLKHSDVLVYAIGIDDDDNDPYVVHAEKYHIYHKMLGDLTSISGGRVYRMYTGRTFAVQGVAQLLLDELHQQYTLSYYPKSREGTQWRQLEVKVSKPGSQIRYKTGYFINTGNSNNNH